MRLCCVLFVLLVLPASAQFTDLAVTDDGRLWFATNLRLQTQPDLGRQSKIYRWDGDFQMTVAATEGGGIVPPTVSQPFMSGDGNIAGFWRWAGCGSPSCGLSGLPKYFVEISGAKLPSDFPLFNGRISRNGRYFVAQKWPAGIVVMDLEKQSVAVVGEGFSFQTRALSVANDGTAVLTVLGDGGTTPLAIWTADGGLQRVAGAENTTAAVISPDARFVAYELGAELMLLDRGTGEQRVIAQRTDTAVLNLFDSLATRFSPSFANDGTLLYVDEARQPVLLSPDGTTRALVTIPEGSREAILAGDGQVAWVETQIGRLLRVNVTDASFTEVLPRTPVITGVRAGAVPGSLVRGWGTGIALDTGIAWPGAQAPVTELKDSAFAFQIPWEYQPVQAGAVHATVKQPGNPFEQVQDLYLTSTVSPTFERGDDPAHRVLQMAHDDFHGVITADDPAVPGETVHLFALNLGPVDQLVRTGAKAPANPAAHITTPFACYLLAKDRVVGARVPFVGLTAGSVGEYQIDITVPDDWPSGETVVNCRTNQLGDTDRFFVR